MPIERILCAVDGSEPSLHAASHAADLAAATGARLTLLHVANMGTAELIGLAGQTFHEVHDHLTERGKAYLQAARRRVAAGVPVDEVVELGDPAEEIVGYAQNHDVDAIVLDSRGQTPLRGMLMGSVSERVVRRASCPVTVVR